ncbi:MAG: hypothetical protein WBD20_10780 [Pirellulaceae bacterium]
MVRHGSHAFRDVPPSSQVRVRLKKCATSINIVAVLVGYFLAGDWAFAQSRSAELGSAGQASVAFPVTTTLELNWSAQQARAWDIELTLQGGATGHFLQLENYCDTSTSCVGFTIAEDGRSIAFASPSRMKNGQFRIRFEGQSDAVLSIQRRAIPESTGGAGQEDAAKPAQTISTATIAKLLSGESCSVIDSGDPNKPTLTLRRLVGDELSLRYSDSSMHYEPGQEFSIVAKANAYTAAQSKELVLKYQLIRVADGQLVDQKNYPVLVDANGNSAPTDISGSVPVQAGVYEVRCQISGEGSALWSRLRRTESLVAKNQLVMIVSSSTRPNGKTASNTGSKLNWESLGKVRSTMQPDWELRQWLPGGGLSLSKLTTAPSRNAGLAQAKHAEEPVSLLDPKGTYATRLPRLQPGLPHRLTVRCPAGQGPKLRVELSPNERFDRDIKTYVVGNTLNPGGELGWHSQSILLYPDVRDQFVRLTNIASDRVVSFESIQVDVGQPTEIGESTDLGNSPHRTALLHLTDFDWATELVAKDSASISLADFHPETVALHRFVTAIEHLKQYLVLAGYNAVAIPGNHNGQTLYSVDQFAALRKPGPSSQHFLSTFLRQFNGSGVTVYVGVDLADIVDTASPSGGDSQSRLLEPQTHVKCRRWLEQLDQQCVSQKSYAGLLISADSPTEAEKAKRVTTLSDGVLRRFESESGLSNASQPTVEAARLRAWVRSDGNKDFLRWCDGQVLAAYHRITAEIRGQVLLVDGTGETRNESNQKLVVVRTSQFKPFAAGTEGAPNGQSTRTSTPCRAFLVGAVQQSGDAKTIDLQSTMNQLVQATSVMDPKWVIIAKQKPKLLWDETLAQALQQFASLPLQEWTWVTGSDPNVQTIRVQHAHVGGESYVMIANLAPWKSNIDLHCTAALEWKQASGPRDVSPNRTPIEVNGRDAVLSMAPSTMVILKATNSNSANPIRTWESRVSGGERALTQIKRQVTTVVERIGSLSQPRSYTALSNGGFERTSEFEQSGNTTIIGWMHTQHPAEAVQIDRSEASEGRQSVVLKSDPANAGRTWIVSEQFSPPSSGRLAVSIAMRGELIADDQTKQELQIAIEGSRDGEPIRYSQTIQLNRDGQWQQRRVVLEAQDITPESVDSIRLTVDSLSRGRVWIDDVQLHDWFPMASERRELQDEAFMAVQGLQRGNLTPASSLLQNYWAQQLLVDSAETPAPQPNVIETAPRRSWSGGGDATPAIASSVQGRTRSEVPLNQRGTMKTSKPPGVAERIKGWLPRPLRF